MSKKMNFASLSLMVFLIVLICVTMSLLSCLNARSAYQMAQKQASSAQQWAKLNNEGQNWLKETINLNPGSYTTELKDDDNHSLVIEVVVSENEYQITKWIYNTSWSEDTNINVWRPTNGN